MKAYELVLREQIIAAYYDEGGTYKDVADRFGVSVSAVRDFLRRYREEGDVSPKPHGGGQRPKLKESEREVLRQLRTEAPMLSIEALNVKFLEATGTTISSQTVWRELKKLGFSTAPIPRKKQSEPRPPFSKQSRTHRCRQRSPAPGPGRDQAYPSDLTDAEWAVLEPLIPQAKSGGRPAEWPKREIVNAILYVLRAGCSWRMLPHDFPPYTTVYDYFRAWRDQGLWERINAVLAQRLRVLAGKNPDPTGAVVDSQSAKTTEKGGPGVTTEPSSYLAGSVTLRWTPRGY